MILLDNFNIFFLNIKTYLSKEKNSFKEIINYYDLEKNSTEPDANAKLLKKRIDQMELILIEYQKQIGDSFELRLCNNTSYKLDDVKLDFETYNQFRSLSLFFHIE
jgi:hypothetical protein